MIRQVVTGSGARVWCPHGHIDTEEGWQRFCSECGEKLNRQEIPHTELMCDVCETHSVSQDMKFCPSCGARAGEPKQKLNWEG